MRIMRQFTQSDLLRTIQGAKINNVSKYVSLLERHGYIVKNGKRQNGKLGGYQTYRLVRDTGPDHPYNCDLCGQPLTSLCAPPQKEKETEKEGGDA